jgi:hypothetical protein
MRISRTGVVIPRELRHPGDAGINSTSMLIGSTSETSKAKPRSLRNIRSEMSTLKLTAKEPARPMSTRPACTWLKKLDADLVVVNDLLTRFAARIEVEMAWDRGGSWELIMRVVDPDGKPIAKDDQKRVFDALAQQLGMEDGEHLIWNTNDAVAYASAAGLAKLAVVKLGTPPPPKMPKAYVAKDLAAKLAAVKVTAGPLPSRDRDKWLDKLDRDFAALNEVLEAELDTKLHVLLNFHPSLHGPELTLEGLEGDYERQDEIVAMIAKRVMPKGSLDDALRLAMDEVNDESWFEDKSVLGYGFDS